VGWLVGKDNGTAEDTGVGTSVVMDEGNDEGAVDGTVVRREKGTLLGCPVGSPDG